MRRLTCLDGLRGILACYVMLSPTAPLVFMPVGLAWLPAVLSHGGAAVDAFFILSGLVILRSLEAFAHAAWPFLIARAARIFPVFLPVFALAVLIRPLDPGFAAMPWIGAADPVRTMITSHWPANSVADVLAHLTMTHGLFPDAVLAHVWVSFLGTSWSLSTEWQFYLLALLLAARCGGAMRLALVFLALSAVALAWAHLAPTGWGFSRAFLPNKVQYFALGVASVAVISEGRAAFARYLAVLAAVLALCVAQGGWGKMAAPLVWTGCLAVQLGFAPPLAALLRARPLLWLGAVSYPLYLVHEPLQKLLLAAGASLAGGDGEKFNVLRGVARRVFWVDEQEQVPPVAREEMVVVELHEVCSDLAVTVLAVFYEAEDFCNSSGSEARLRGTASHREGLPRSCLSVCKQTDVEAVHEGLHEASSVFEHLTKRN